MNWLLLVVVLIIAWNIVIGYTKGFVRIVYSLISWLLIIMLSIALTPHISKFITDNTSVQTDIKNVTYDKLKEEVSGSQENQSSAEVQGEQDNQAQEQTDDSLEKLGIKIPESIVKNILGEDTENIADGILEETGLYETISEKISLVAVDGISFALSILAIGLLFRIIYQALSIVDKLPVINGINKAFGIIMGFLKGMLIVWTIFAIVAMSCTSEYGMIMISYIYENPLLQIIYENNLVLTIIFLIL